MENLVNMQVPPVIIGIIAVALSLLDLFVSKIQNKDETKTPEIKPVEKTTVPGAKAEITPEILAVITAAVAHTMNKGRSSYKITTIKRIDLNSGWNKLAKMEQVQSYGR